MNMNLRILDKGPYFKYAGEVGGGGGGGGERRVLQIFQIKFGSPGDHRAKYFMVQ